MAEEETAECPVCGKSVGLSLSTCPNCGAEFEEEEVEEVIEVEEKEAPVKEPEVEEEEQEAIQVEEQEASVSHPTSVIDLRVIGVALIILGIIGSQISAMIKWYWTWVPPIKSNLGMFIGVAAVVIVVGLLVYMLVQRAMSSGKKVPSMMPNLSLSLFLFGIFALILIMLWSPINSALQHSSLGVAGAFLGIFDRRRARDDHGPEDDRQGCIGRLSADLRKPFRNSLFLASPSIRYCLSNERCIERSGIGLFQVS